MATPDINYELKVTVNLFIEFPFICFYNLNCVVRRKSSTHLKYQFCRESFNPVGSSRSTTQRRIAKDLNPLQQSYGNINLATVGLLISLWRLGRYFHSWTESQKFHKPPPTSPAVPGFGYHFKSCSLLRTGGGGEEGGGSDEKHVIVLCAAAG